MWSRKEADRLDKSDCWLTSGFLTAPARYMTPHGCQYLVSCCVLK